MKKPSIDQSAAAMGAVLTLLGVFNVAALLEITADELAVAVGAIASLAGLARQHHERRKGGPLLPPMEDPGAEIYPATVKDTATAEILLAEGDG